MTSASERKVQSAHIVSQVAKLRVLRVLPLRPVKIAIVDILALALRRPFAAQALRLDVRFSTGQGLVVRHNHVDVVLGILIRVPDPSPVM